MEGNNMKERDANDGHLWSKMMRKHQEIQNEK
jgi:hypothetical protein